MGKQKLETRTDGAVEVLRVYRVNLLRPDLTGDDGEPIVYPVEVALRYEKATADMLDPKGPAAFDEAERRAVKVERRDYGLDETVPLFVEPGTELLRAKVVPARVGKGGQR